jgi:hypothetical protein
VNVYLVCVSLGGHHGDIAVAEHQPQLVRKEAGVKLPLRILRGPMGNTCIYIFE